MSITQQLKARDHDLGGGFTVRRMLPSGTRQSVGPFVFFDHFGPVTVHPEDNHDVRPHPHIGLATVTYLFNGAIQHHDNLGYRQRIEPGAINWMTAGRGIVHSERRPVDLADKTYVNHGIQLWAALPTEHEGVEPSFHHQPADTIPYRQSGSLTVRALVGSIEFDGQTLSSPVPTLVNTLYLDVEAQGASRFSLPAFRADQATPVQQRSVYPVDASLIIDGEMVPAGVLAILADNSAAVIESSGPARYLVLGGAPLDGHRFIYWNFVSSRKDLIEQASLDWDAGKFAPVEGETERIELPVRRT